MQRWIQDLPEGDATSYFLNDMSQKIYALELTAN